MSRALHTMILQPKNESKKQWNTWAGPEHRNESTKITFYPSAENESAENTLSNIYNIWITPLTHNKTLTT